MAESDADRSPSSPSASLEERAIKEGAWQVIQQGAQVVGELGGGIGGIAAAVHVATNLKSGHEGSQGYQPSSTPPTQPQVGDDT